MVASIKPYADELALGDGRMLIGGEWVTAADEATWSHTHPATGERVAEFPVAGAADVDSAVRAARKLVQMTVDSARLPMPFDRVQCADLTGWSGDPDAPGWRKVLASLRDLMRAAATPSRRIRSAAVEPLLAVLAFDNLSGDAEMAYFSDGVSEEILQTVARGA